MSAAVMCARVARKRKRAGDKSVTSSSRTLSHNVFLYKEEEMTRVGGLLELKKEITSRQFH